MEMECRGDVSRKRRSTADEEQMARPSSKRRGGGIYVPPYRAIAEDDDDAGEFGSAEYQRRSWNALRKSITGLVNKATAANVRHVAAELLAENLVRGRGLLCRALLTSQAACPELTDVFAALAAAVNASLPGVGRLLLARLVLRVRRCVSGGGGDTRHKLAAAAKFVAHLVNQGVAHELLALELLALLLSGQDRPVTTDGGAVEVAVGFARECGAALGASCPRGLDAVFVTLRGVLRDGDVDRRVQFMIEDLFAIRKARFRGHPPVRPELDLVEADDQVTHHVELSSILDVEHGDELDPELHLDVFQPSPSFSQDEAAYEDLKRTILGADQDQCDDDDESSGNDDLAGTEPTSIRDDTDADLINLRRTIYLTVMSSVGSEEAGHKLLSVVRPGQEPELCAMLVECCKKERAACTGYYGRLAQRLCLCAGAGGSGRAYQAGFAACFAAQYAAAHRTATDELRAAAGLYAHLLAADALPWRAVLGRVRVTEEDTASSSRILLKMLFQGLAERLGVRALSSRMNDDEGDAAVRDALFPRDCAKNTRFAVNFFTAIGLGGVTESARKLIV